MYFDKPIIGVNKMKNYQFSDKLSLNWCVAKLIVAKVIVGKMIVTKLMTYQKDADWRDILQVEASRPDCSRPSEPQKFATSCDDDHISKTWQNGWLL